MSFILTVFFEDPFWVGLFTISESNTARYCRVVFGREPSDTEIYHFFNQNYHHLKFSPSLPSISQSPTVKNPKKRQREASRYLHQQFGQKKSYEFIKQSLKSSQKERREAESKQQRKEFEDHIVQLKQIKKKEKHRGH